MVWRNSVWSFVGVRSDLSCKMKVAQDYFSSALSYICNRSRKNASAINESNAKTKIAAWSLVPLSNRSAWFP